MSKFTLGIIVGSNRKDSINRKLALALAKLGANAFEPVFIRIDDLPLYNQDLEASLPEEVSRFKKHVEESDALLFVTPEHSRSIPAVLKSALDWGARPWGNTPARNNPARTGERRGGCAACVLRGTTPGGPGGACWAGWAGRWTACVLYVSRAAAWPGRPFSSPATIVVRTACRTL